MNKHIYITGSSGFLANHLCQTLESYKVIGLTSQKREDRMTNEAFFALNEVEEGAILIHAAFARGSSQEAVESSMDFFYKIMDKAVELDFSAIINISSQSVYDPYRIEKAKEKDLLRPKKLYGVAKAFTESYLENMERLGVTSLRLASLVGPGFDQRLTTRLLHQAIETGKLELFDQENRFSFLHIEDACQGIKSMLDSDPKDWFSVYNLGTEETYTLEEMASTIEKTLASYGRKVDINIQKKKARPENNSLSCQRFYEDFSWRAKTNLSMIIEEEAKRRLG